MPDGAPQHITGKDTNADFDLVQTGSEVGVEMLCEFA